MCTKQISECERFGTNCALNAFTKRIAFPARHFDMPLNRKYIRKNRLPIDDGQAVNKYGTVFWLNYKHSGAIKAALYNSKVMGREWSYLRTGWMGLYGLYEKRITALIAAKPSPQTEAVAGNLLGRKFNLWIRHLLKCLKMIFELLQNWLHIKS